MTRPDDAWLRAVVARYQEPLRAFAMPLAGGDAGRAADAVQETFVRLWRADLTVAVADLRPPRAADSGPRPAAEGELAGDDDRVASWLFAVCRNVCVDAARRAARIQRADAMAEAPRGPTDPARRLAARDGLAEFLAVFEQLPTSQREVLTLKLREGLSYKEIAARTGRTVSHVGWLLHTALKTVRARCPWRDEPTNPEEAR